MAPKWGDWVYNRHRRETHTEIPDEFAGRSNPVHRLCVFTLLILLDIHSLGYAAMNSALFTTVSYPGSRYTEPRGINNNGEIVGSYETASGARRGFLLSSGTYTSISRPGSTRTVLEAINNKGQIVGRDETNTGFLLSGGEYTSIRFPGATSTYPSGINDEGQIVGSYSSGGGTHAFLYSSGVYTTISFPGAGQTVATGINNYGQIVGWYDSPSVSSRGFLYCDDTYTPLPILEAAPNRGLGISNNGQIVGFYHSADISMGCFVWSGHSSSIFGLIDTVPQSCKAINDHGQVVGTTSYGETETTFGFLTTAPGVPIRTGVFSHIAAGGGWDTTITLINTSSIPVETTLRFFADNGSGLDLPLEITQKGGTELVKRSQLDRTIDPNTSLLITTGARPSTVVGWADVTSTGPLGGFAIFRQQGSGPASEGTVPLQTRFASTMTLPYDNTSSLVMGVALANLATEPATMTATIWDESGRMLGTQNIPLAGSGHTSFVLPTGILLTSGRRGILQFQTTGTRGMAGLGLRFSPLMTFTSVPPI
jgi:probable HAF family extracellular repeat protein